MKRIGHISQSLLAPLMRRYPHWHLMVQWPSIVGSQLAPLTWPEKILDNPHTGGILYIQVDENHALDVWANSCVILERVNQFFGFQAVKQIRLHQKYEKKMP